MDPRAKGDESYSTNVNDSMVRIYTTASTCIFRKNHHNSSHHKEASRKMEESKSNVIDDSYVASDEPNKSPKKLIKETILQSFDDYKSDSERDLSSPPKSALCIVIQ